MVRYPTTNPEEIRGTDLLKTGRNLRPVFFWKRTAENEGRGGRKPAGWWPAVSEDWAGRVRGMRSSGMGGAGGRWDPLGPYV